MFNLDLKTFALGVAAGVVGRATILALIAKAKAWLAAREAAAAAALKNKL